MSAKTIINATQILSNVSMTNPIATTPTSLKIIDNSGFQMVWTGAPVGTFNVQVSLDYKPGQFPDETPQNAGNWITLPLNTPITASGVPDIAYADLALMSSPWVRLIYTPTSGTGSLSVWVTGKSVS